jgi:hypothetical protein
MPIVGNLYLKINEPSQYCLTPVDLVIVKLINTSFHCIPFLLITSYCEPTVNAQSSNSIIDLIYQF